MSTQGLPAASLRTGNRLPAARVLLRVSNYLIYMVLWLISRRVPAAKRIFSLLSGRAPLLRGVELIAGHRMVRPDATAISDASLPGPPTIDRPTGRPSTVAPGMLTCGTPVRPP